MISGKRVKIFLQLLGPLIFIYILLKIDYQLFLKEIGSLKWYFLILSAGLMTLEIVVRSLRWRTVLLSLNIKMLRINSISLHWLGMFVGVITPGRLGELIKVYFLKNKGHDRFRSFFSIILDRIFDIFALLFLGLLISFFFFKDIGLYIIFLGIVLLLVIVFIFLLMDQKTRLHKVFSRLLKKIIPIDFKNYSRFTFNKFWQGIKKVKTKEILSFFTYLILSWFLYFLARYLISLSLGLTLSFVDITVISVLTAIITLLPISIAGLGTREAAVIYFFSFFGLNKEIAVLFSLLIFTVDILIIAFGLIPYLKESRLINKVKSEAIRSDD